MQLTAPSGFAFVLSILLILGARSAHAQDVAGSKEGAQAREAAGPPDAPKTEAPAEGAASPPAAARDIDVRAVSEVGAYGDTDHVYVVTPSIGGTIAKPTAGWSVDARYLVDVVSAASVDIVSTASRRWEEVRHAGTISGAYKPSTFGVSADASFSREPDYVAWTAGGAITQDVLDKNVTWTLGFNHGHDVAGRSTTPFSVFSHPVNREAFKGGLTILLDPATVASFIGDVVIENGDTSKPYRYIALFAPGTNVPLGASIDLVNALRVSERPLEQLPTSRDRFALTGRIAHRYAHATLRLDERLYADSWSLKATSTDARYLFDASTRWEMGPHLRFHAQTPVSFWERAYILRPGFDYPALRTGDRELGPLLNMTGGWTFRVQLGPEARRSAWVLGFDLNVTETRYLDDLYTTQRLSTLGGFTLEAEL